MEGQTTGNSPLFATVHRPFKVDAEKGRRVGLKGKKEGRQAEREKWQEGINKCVPQIKCESIGHRSRGKEGMKKGGKGATKERREGSKVVTK